MKITMNETRVAVVETLKTAEKPMTLNEIAELIGVELKTGTTNAMVSSGLIKKVGTKKVPVITYREVATYEIGDLSILENESESK